MGYSLQYGLYKGRQEHTTGYRKECAAVYRNDEAGLGVYTKVICDQYHKIHRQKRNACLYRRAKQRVHAPANRVGNIHGQFILKNILTFIKKASSFYNLPVYSAAIRCLNRSVYELQEN